MNQPDQSDGAADNGTASSSDNKSTDSAPTRTIGAALGEITWLLAQSPTHRNALFVGDLEWLVMPALRHSQYRVFYSEGRPAGVAVWAFVSEAAAKRLAQGGRLAVQEWRSGAELWLVDLIAPFGGQEAMLADLRSTVFADRSFRYLRTQPDGRREVVEAAGASPPSAQGDASAAGD